MSRDGFEKLYFLTTRLQALRDMVAIARIGCCPELKEITRIAFSGIGRLEIELDELRKQLVEAS